MRCPTTAGDRSVHGRPQESRPQRDAGDNAHRRVTDTFEPCAAWVRRCRRWTRRLNPEAVVRPSTRCGGLSRHRDDVAFALSEPLMAASLCGDSLPLVISTL